MSLKLEGTVSSTHLKQEAVSDDGKWCAIGGGPNFYLTDIPEQRQYQLKPEKMSNAYSVCFINGESDRVVIGDGGDGKFEIWDIGTRTAIKTITGLGGYCGCMCSVNNILAIGFNQGKLGLYDVRTWELV